MARSKIFYNILLSKLYKKLGVNPKQLKLRGHYISEVFVVDEPIKIYDDKSLHEYFHYIGSDDPKSQVYIKLKE